MKTLDINNAGWFMGTICRYATRPAAFAVQWTSSNCNAAERVKTNFQTLVLLPGRSEAPATSKGLTRAVPKKNHFFSKKNCIFRFFL